MLTLRLFGIRSLVYTERGLYYLNRFTGFSFYGLGGGGGGGVSSSPKS